MNGSQHRRVVGALLAARFDQPRSLEAGEHPVQQELLAAADNETGTELGQHAEVEARICQFETERVLPVVACTYGVGR